MEKNFSWKNLENGFVALAPMAGVTDSPFRQICRSFGADVVFTEFVHVRGLSGENKKSLDLLKYSESERPIIAQIFGNEPKYFHKAAKIVEKLGFDGVDINMGCPARKVKGHGSGSALIEELSLAKDIIVATKEAVSIPVSVKTRLGTNSYEGPAFVQGLEEAGAELITIHGRTVSQKFGGKADLEAIADIVQSVRIPVIGNGDIVDFDSYLRMMSTGCFGAMIGRGAYGNPWIFKSIKEQEDYSPSLQEIKEVIRQHALAFKKEKRDQFVQIRKHLAWYTKGIPNSCRIRSELVQVNDYSDIIKVIESF